MHESHKRPIKHKLGMAFLVLLCGSLGIPIGAMWIDAIIGDGSTAFHDTTPLFLFGFVVVGISIVGFAIVEFFKGRRQWDELVIGSVWLFFFGRAFLQTMGIEF